MRFITILFLGFLAASYTAIAQIELVSADYFPADLEFAELHNVVSKESFDDPARLSKIQNGNLFSDVGFTRYARRDYSAGDKGSLSVEIVTLLDARASFSVLTLLRSGNIQDGPPGDAFTVTGEEIRFSQGNIFVRIQGRATAEDLPKRVAVSVSNRIGPLRRKLPSLVSHLPKLGYDRSSLRYYPGTKVYENYAGSFGPKSLRIELDAEIAQARYTLDNRTGTLSLLSFPTPEAAEEYFDKFSGHSEKGTARSYAKRAGPMVGILEGPFDPGAADRILKSIQYRYSVRWVYEKGNQPKTIWGVPAGILSTVVKSLFFVVLLFGISILAGIGFAVLRVVLRRRALEHSPDQQDPTEITRLRMR